MGPQTDEEQITSEQEHRRTEAIERISRVLGFGWGEEVFTPIDRSLDRIADALERIANALGR